VNPGHYRKGKIQPIDFIEAQGLGFHEANCVKYLARWKYKNGLEDLEKARWYLDRLIQVETAKQASLSKEPSLK